VLPLALVALLWWLARAGNATRTVPTVLGLAGVTAYGRLLFAGLAGEMTWTSASTGQGTPGTAGYQAVRPLLLDYRAFQLAWIAGCVLLAAVGWWSTRRHPGPANAVPSNAAPLNATEPSSPAA